MTFSFSITSILMLGFFCPNASAQEPSQADQAKVGTQIGEYLATYHGIAQFSGSALVAERGEIVYQGAFGLANADWKLSNRVDTKYRLASVSKQFTAMLVLLLVEDGVLELDAPIIRYLPSYPANSGAKVTVHHLLNHTSGIPNYTNRQGFMQREALLHHTTEEFVAEYCSDPLEFDPGDYFHYSNSGYYLLAAIIESVTGQSYGEALREWILDPLGMQDTGNDDQGLVLNNRATGYSELLGQRRVARRVHTTSFVGAGSLYSTVGDLWKWEQALRSGQLLGRSEGELEAKMFEQGKGNYGYGWFVDRSNVDEPLFWHAGIVSGFSTMTQRSPEQGRYIVLLSNLSGSSVQEAVEGITAILDGRVPTAPTVEPELALARRVLDDGIEAGLSEFAELSQSIREQRIERNINAFGYQLFGQGRVSEAMLLLRFNTQAFPEIANTWDSLGEAYLLTGKSELAIENYRKALALDHASLTAIEMLKKLDSTRTAASQRASVGSLESLKERSEYADLDKQAVEALARVAEARWREQFSRFTYERVEHFSAGGVSHWISIWLHAKTGLEFALVPGGKFQMGSPTGEANRKEDELQHWVNLDPFLIARTECTQEAWARLAGPDDDSFVGSARLPKVGMFPEHVDTWCRQVHLTLPTEAQWEFLCRAGTTSAWAMGANKNDLERFAYLGSAECPEGWTKMSGITESWHDGYGAEASPVAMFAANAFGLFDVHGNVSEWSRDQYFDYEVSVEVGTGRRPGVSEERIARGGNFGGDATAARSAARFHCGRGISPGANNGFGFRPSLDLPGPVSLEGWPSETFALPPDFAPDLPTGIESLRFAPGWRDPSTEEFWSYTFVMWIDEPAPDATRIGELLDSYYDGLLLTFAGSAGKDIGSNPAEVEVTATSPGHFEAKMNVVDAFATFDPLELRVLVSSVTSNDDRTVLRIRLSPQPEGHAIWRSLEAAVAGIQD